jgi:hypothetical protein
MGLTFDVSSEKKGCIFFFFYPVFYPACQIMGPGIVTTQKVPCSVSHKNLMASAVALIIIDRYSFLKF